MEKLKREISRSHLLFISFSAIFGSGWLFAPLYAAQIAGPSSLIAWCLGALMSAVIGITIAEVVVLYPKSGGLTQVARITHGEFLSLTVTIFNLVVFIILPAIEVRAILQYLSAYFDSLSTAQGGISGLGYLLAFVLLPLITLVNLYGARVTVALTQVMVLFKLITPGLICICFLAALHSAGTLDHSRVSSSLTSFSSIPWTEVFQAIATSGIIFSFNGFNQATLFAGEARNPQRAIPFAIFGSLLMSGLLYLLVQYVFLMAVPEASLAQGWSQLQFAGDQGPFAGLAVLLGFGALLSVIYADAVISPLGTAFSYASAAPRLLYSLAEGFSSPGRLLKLNRHGIPSLAIWITLGLECLVFLLLPNLKAMIALLVAAFVLCYTTAPASLLMLRKTQPHLHRSFRVSMAPVVSYFSLLFSNLMVFSCGWIALRNLIGVSVVLLGIFFVFSNRRGNKGGFREQLRGGEWFLFQLGSIAALCFYHDFYPISFGVVLFGIGGISLVSLFMSQLPRSMEIGNIQRLASVEGLVPISKEPSL